MHYDDLLEKLKDPTEHHPIEEQLPVTPPKQSKKTYHPTDESPTIIYDLLIKNARIATMDMDNRIIERANIAIKDGIILLITTDHVPIRAEVVIHADEQLITPGLIDCHTHLIYAEHRQDRALHSNQHAISILPTVHATRRASLESLVQQAMIKAKIMLAHGTTTVEIKSSYGLELNTEIKLLTAAKMLGKNSVIRVIPTFLGGYAIPSEYQNNPDQYIDHMIATMLPTVANKKLAQFVDVLCGSAGFTPAQVKRLFEAAKQYGFKLKLHAEQLSDNKGALLAASFGACSVDHLEYLHAEDCQHLANGSTVAVLLPGTAYFLKTEQRPPVAALRKQGVPMAIATDANPETSPFLTLPMIMNMACVLFELTVTEAWQGVTIHAAKALNLEDEIGSIEVGKKADLIIWSTDRLEDVVYNPSINFCKTVIQSGRVVSLLPARGEGARQGG